MIKARTLPSGKTGYRARYTDPETGKEKYVTLDLLALPTAEARTLWAKRFSQQLAKQRMDIAAGLAPKVKPEGLSDATDDWLENAGHRLRKKTIDTYRLAIAQLNMWAQREGVTSTGDLTAARLASLRDYLVRQPKHAVRKGARRGARKRTAEKRSPLSVNRELRTIKTVLGDWRTAGLLPGLHRDDIFDALKNLPTPREAPEFLSPSQLEKLLGAAKRHDTAMFKATRKEHATRRSGSTLRYMPIAPFVAFLLLTGCRRGEALGLTWDVVDLDAVDHEGRRVGEIRLAAGETKTHRARVIGLEVSPALRTMLAALKLGSRGKGHVFGGTEPHTADMIEATRKRLVREYGAPRFDWQTLRSTASTYLVNAPGIYGSATIFLAAKQLGHSVAVAEKHYAGVFRGIAKEARTLEAAMQIEKALAGIGGASSAPREAAKHE